MLRTHELPPTSAAPMRQSTLYGGLAGLEGAVLHPVVPGELHDWIDGVLNEVDDLQLRYDDWLVTQRTLHEELAKRDRALAHRAIGIEHRMARCHRDFAALTIAIEDIAIMGNGTHAAADALGQLLLEWVVEVRQLEREATTWWTETLYRGRGAH